MSRKLRPLLPLIATVVFLFGTVGSGTARPPCHANAPQASCPPQNVTLPGISGSAIEGQLLTAAVGSWNGTPPLTFAYQWRRCDGNGANCTSVGGATSQSYLLSTTDVGATLR